MEVKVTRLDNGLTVVTDHMPHLQSAALGVWVNAGSRAENESEHGLAHLLEHMAFKGTKSRSAAGIAEEIEAVGGELNAATSIENTAYYARVLSDDVPLAVDILADILQNAVLDPEELAKEQHVILQEIGASLDMPEDLVFDRFQQTAFSGQSIGRPILGTPESVTNFTPDTISFYLGKHYTSQEMVVSAAGDVDHDSFAKLVEGKFDHVVKGHGETSKPAQYTGGELVENRDLQEVQILLGFEGKSYQDDDFFTIQFLVSVLGGGMSSRLFQEVREKRGLCYSIYAFHWAYSDTGLFGIHAATGDEDIEELMPVILHELKRLTDDLDEKEMARTKAQMRAGLLMSLESPATRATQLARHLLIFGRVIPPHEQIERLDAVTVDDIKRLASTLFTSSKPTLTAIGPVDKLMSSEEIERHLKA